jgi:hypothetical protein
MLSLILIGGMVLAAPHGAPRTAEKAGAVVQPESKQDKIRALLELTGSDQTGANILAGLRSQLPAAQYEAIAKVFKPEQLTEQFVAIFDRHYSEAEIDGQLAFYKSPLGKRMIAEGPAITTESVKASQQYALSKMAEIRRAQADVPVKSP